MDDTTKELIRLAFEHGWRASTRKDPYYRNWWVDQEHMQASYELYWSRIND